LLPNPVTTLQKLETSWSDAAGVHLYIVRDDLNHPRVQGNKLRKLAPVLARVVQTNRSGIITFGGAFSNHLYAVAAAAEMLQLGSVGIVRGTWVDLENPTLAAVRAMSMRLHLVSATAYKAGFQHPDVAQVLAQYPDYELIPEGGTTPEAIRGCISLGSDIAHFLQLNCAANTPQHVFIPMGTGGTATGTLHGLSGQALLHIIAPTKSETDRERIYQHQRDAQLPENHAFEIHHDFTFGGFGRRNAALDLFIEQFQQETSIMLDPVYTCKSFYAAKSMLENGSITKGSTVVLIHTGGIR
jgi:1-aminocyclopropane-1-carboxylate deaminase